MPRRRCDCHCRCCLQHHATKRKWDREAFIEARVDGICGRCRKMPADNGFRTCTGCRAIQLLSQRACRMKRRARRNRRVLSIPLTARKQAL